MFCNKIGLHPWRQHITSYRFYSGKDRTRFLYPIGFIESPSFALKIVGGVLIGASKTRRLVGTFQNRYNQYNNQVESNGLTRR